RLNRTSSGLHTPDFISADAYARDLRAVEGFHTPARRGVDVSHDNAVWVHQSILSMKGSGQCVIKSHQRQSSADFIATQPFGLDAKLVLKLNIALKRCDIFFVRQCKKITALAIIHILPDLFFETFDHRQAGQRKPNVDLRAELITDSARATTGRALTEEFFFLQQDDVLRAACREMISRAGSHHAAADDDDVC